MRGPASAADLLEVARTLLLVQGAILVANTLEAALFAIAFSGGLTLTVVLTAVAALTIFVARARLGATGSGHRPVYIVEGTLIATFVIDTLLGLILTHQGVPIVAALTRLVIPVGVVILVRRMSHAARANIAMAAAA